MKFSGLRLRAIVAWLFFAKTNSIEFLPHASVLILVYFTGQLAFSRKDYGAVVCGPPCSLFVWISRGTHLRNSHGKDIFGDVSKRSVRMANSIVRNFVPSSGFATLPKPM